MKKIWDQFNQGVRLPHFHLNSCELNAKLTVKKPAEVTSKKNYSRSLAKGRNIPQVC